jgi:hypothetical protein
MPTAHMHRMRALQTVELERRGTVGFEEVLVGVPGGVEMREGDDFTNLCRAWGGSIGEQELEWEGRTDEGGEGFVEPETARKGKVSYGREYDGEKDALIPPLQRHQVPEVHMRRFVRNRSNNPLHRCYPVEF